MGESIVVSVGEIRCSAEPGNILVAPDIGAGVCVCAYDPQLRIAALAHIALPSSADTDTVAGRFADTAIPALVERITEAGGDPGRVRVAIVGGAELAAFRGNGARLNLGLRNTAAVKAALDAANLPIVASEVGGIDGRTLLLTADGRVCSKSVGKREHEVVSLGFTGAFQARSA